MASEVERAAIGKAIVDKTPFIKSEQQACLSAGPPLPAGGTRGTHILQENLPEHPTAVIIGCSIYKLGSVEPISQSFYADIRVHMWWFEPSLVEQHPIDTPVQYLKPESVKVPELWFENAISIEEVGETAIETRAKYKPGVVHWERRVRGNFSEVFEVSKFPYDVQVLTVLLRINSQADHALNRCVMLDNVLPRISPQVSMPEWSIYETSEQVYPDKRGRLVHYAAHIPIWRRHEYFSYNVIGLLCGICSLSFSAFALSPEDFGDRSSIVLTLLLTAVAFKFAISDSLPKVPYMTVLDKYFILCFSLLLLQMVQNAIIVEVDEEARHNVDFLYVRISATIWAAVNLAFVFMVRSYVTRVAKLLGPEIRNIEPSVTGNKIVQAQTVNMLQWRSASRLQQQFSETE